MRKEDAEEEKEEMDAASNNGDHVSILLLATAKKLLRKCDKQHIQIRQFTDLRALCRPMNVGVLRLCLSQKLRALQEDMNE